MCPAALCYNVSRGKLLSDIKALIVFDIIEEDGADVVNSWVFNCSGKEVLDKTDMVQVQRQTDGAPVKIKYDAKIICSDSTFAALSKGKISPEFAYMRGTLKIKGQLNAALKVKTLLSHAANMMK